MPQVFTDLNPNLPGGETAKSTLKSSEGFQGDSSLGTALKGAGDLLSMAVGTIDLGIKTDIKETARQKIDEVQNEFGVGAIATTQGIPRAQEIPEDLRRSTEALQDLKRGYNQGVLSQSTYWARLESISRQLRSRYAGHRDFIDQTISGITGGIPANKLVEALRREADVGSGESDEAKFQRQYIKENEKYLPEGYHTGRAGEIFKDFNYLREYVSTKKRIDFNREQSKAELDFRAAGTKAQIETLTDMARRDATATVANNLKPLTDEVYANITSANAQVKSKGAVDPALEKKLTTQLAELDLSVDKQIRNVLSNSAYDMLPKEAKDNIIKGIQEQYSYLKTAALDKAVGPFGALKRGFDASRLNTDIAMEANPLNSIVISVNKNMGAAAAAEIFRAKLPDIAGPAPLKSLIQDVIKGRIALGQIDIDEAIKYGFRKGATAAEINQPLKDLLDVAGNPTVDRELRKKLIMNTFQNPEKVERLLEYGPDGKRLNAQTRTALFNTLVRPDVSRTVKEINDSAVQQRYGEWVTRAASVVYRADINDLNAEMPKDRIKVTFNPDTYQFSAQALPLKAGEPPLLKQRMNTLANTANKQLEIFNSKIKTLVPIWKDSGLDPVEEIKSLHNAIGTTPERTEGYVPLKNAILNALPYSIQGGEGRSEKKGGEGNDRIQSFINSQGVEVPLTRANVREFIDMWNREEEVVPSLSAQMELEGARESTNVEDVSQFQRTGPGRFAAPDLVNEDPNFRNPTVLNKRKKSK